ncbi:MAG: CaiB/BaiF CoA-transferase family protein [Pseudomonadota bacterium]
MSSTAHNSPCPLAGITVVEFSQMVMGPTVGLILADLGADVIKVEPLKGDNTRRLVGSGAGYFPMYNRNKRSICLDIKSADGMAAARKLIDTADVFVENFRPGGMDKLGLGYEALSETNPGLIYCSAKGFLTGPYDHRTALDEVTQMMGGLAYMTGPPGQPLRAGSSVIDMMGGMFGAIAVQAALVERARTGKGQHVTSSLYESTVFSVGQHMAQMAVTGQPAKPMPARISAWAVYDKFETKEGELVFIGVVSDTQWQKFCDAFGLDDWAQDEALAKNAGRVAKRDEIIPKLNTLFKGYVKDDLTAKLEDTGLPFAPIAKPEDLFDDAHLNASGGLLPLTMPNNGESTKLPNLPIEMGGERLGLRKDLTKPGDDTRDVLTQIGYSESDIDALINSDAAA